MKNFLKKVFIRFILFFEGLNQAFKVLIFGGPIDQTFSSYTYESNQLGFLYGKIARPIIDTLFYYIDGKRWQHCARAFNADTEHTWAKDGSKYQDINAFQWAIYREEINKGDLKKKTPTIEWL